MAVTTSSSYAKCGRALRNKSAGDIGEISWENIRLLINEGIIYIKPVYVEGMGLQTGVKTEKREIFSGRKVEEVIDFILFEFTISRAALKSKTSAILNQRNALPMCINTKNLFVPFKMIKPVCGDNAKGFINYIYISGVEEEKKRDRKTSTVKLDKYGEIEILSTRKTALRHFRECYLVASQLFSASKLELVF